MVVAELTQSPALVKALGEDAVRALGRRYASDTPAEGHRNALISAVERDASRLRPYPWSDSPSLDTLITDDFANGHTVLADGWILSVNEARQCALFALDSA